MDPKEMAKILRKEASAVVFLDACKTDAITQAADFLDALPEIPEGYTWDGDIRLADPGEDFLNSDGGVTHWEGPHCTTTHAYPILRKLPPKFQPGDIVRRTDVCDGSCRVVLPDGTPGMLDGSLAGGCLGECALATRDDVVAYTSRYPQVVGDAITHLLREKYGEGEE